MSRENKTLDPIHIQQNVYDSETESNKVKIVGTEMAISLDASEDSIQSVPKVISSSEKETEISCKGIKTVAIYGKGDGDLILEVSPSETDDVWYEIARVSLSTDQIQRSICALRMRLKGQGTGYLVGMSI